jgi:hypothetical protein
MAAKSGKERFKRPALSETVRAVIRLVSGREWSSEKLFQNRLKSRGGEAKGHI